MKANSLWPVEKKTVLKRPISISNDQILDVREKRLQSRLAHNHVND